MTSRSTSREIPPWRKDNLRPALTLATVALAAGMAPFADRASAEWLGDRKALMGTEISVRLWHDDKVAGESAVEAVFAEIVRINELMSTYIEDSRISLINSEAADRAVPAGDELYDLIVRSLDISILTRGAFDITYDSVGQHYDFPRRQRPDRATIEQELNRVNYRLVKTDPSTKSVHFLQPGVRINLGGIAKGYAVERGAGILRELGIRHAIVSVGGDSRLVGDRRGKPWIIGVRDPRHDGEVAIEIPLENEAISTSGDYERYFEEEGKRYHDIIQPATGEPANGVHSATIVGPDAVITDALSTSVVVMGVDQGLRLIATLPDYEGIVIDADGQLFYSDGLRRPGQM
jgi:FAD:protein FMN transferase